MPKRIIFGVLMTLAGLGLLTPTVWMLFSPFVQYLAASSGAGLMVGLTAALGGAALIVSGVRRMFPAQAVLARAHAPAVRARR
jgi:hypothetical protein